MSERKRIERAERAREKLARIRTAQGWRAVEQAIGYTPKPNESEATRRRRVSRLINKRTSGFKPLTTTETKRVNRSFGQRKKAIANASAEQAIARIEKLRAEARRQARRTFGRNGTTPDPEALRARLDQNAPMTEEEKQAIRDGALDPNEFKQFRASYVRALRTIDRNSLPLDLMVEYDRTLARAEEAVRRDQE